MSNSNCPFCDIEASQVVASNDSFMAIRDAYPVAPLHTLIVSNRHVGTYFELTREEVLTLHDLVVELKNALKAGDATVTGFNVGFNAGEDAGQTVMHFHLHVIPRRKGDMDDPRGGVRGVIPGKRSY